MAGEQPTDSAPPEPTGYDGPQYFSQADIDMPVHQIIEQDGTYDEAADLDDEGSLISSGGCSPTASLAAPLR